MKGYWINHVIDIEDPERFGVDSISKAMEIYYSPEYGAALAAGAWREMRPTSFSVPYVQLRCHSKKVQSILRHMSTAIVAGFCHPWSC